MSMTDARLDHLMLRLDSLHDRLLNRADQLDNEAVSLEVMRQMHGDVMPTSPGREPGVLRVIAAEFREIAGSIE